MEKFQIDIYVQAIGFTDLALFGLDCCFFLDPPPNVECSRKTGHFYAIYRNMFFITYSCKISGSATDVDFSSHLVIRHLSEDVDP